MWRERGRQGKPTKNAEIEILMFSSGREGGAFCQREDKYPFTTT